VRDQRGAAVSGADDVDHVEVVALDDPVEVDAEHVQARRRAPVAEQPRLDVLPLERLLQERVVQQVDLPDRQVVRGPPPQVDLLQLLPVEYVATAHVPHPPLRRAGRKGHRSGVEPGEVRAGARRSPASAYCRIIARNDGLAQPVVVPRSRARMVLLAEAEATFTGERSVTGTGDGCTNEGLARRDCIDRAIHRLDLNQPLALEADLSVSGAATIQIPSSFARELLYNIEHAIHHMALVQVAVQNAFPTIELPQHFGVAYSTVQHQSH